MWNIFVDYAEQFGGENEFEDFGSEFNDDETDSQSDHILEEVGDDSQSECSMDGGGEANNNLSGKDESYHAKSSGRKPFSCTLCDKSFAQKSHLTGHVNAVHRKLKPFSCTLCNKSFRDKPYLKQHVDAVHNKLKPFSCTLCDKSFSSKSNLSLHIRHHHRK